VTLSQKNAAGALFKTLSKFAVNAVQQIDSAIISSLQRMPWIAVFSAGDETPSTSTMFWPTKAMHSRPMQWPLEKHGHLEWLIMLTARVVSMSIWTWDGGVIQRQTSDVESQQGITRWRIAVKAAVSLCNLQPVKFLKEWRYVFWLPCWEYQSSSSIEYWLQPTLQCPRHAR